MNSSLEVEQEKKTNFIDGFSEEVFNVTYAYGNETIDECHERVAKDLASLEKESIKDFWVENFKWLLQDFKFVPGGRILSNAGTGLKGTSYINCFVSGFQGENQDSMISILDELRRQAMILKSEGGYGINIDVLRPRGGFIDGIGNESPGAVKMLDMWDTQSAVITSGSGKKSSKSKAKVKIRKGAQMVTMSCWHPDVEEYITAKQTPGKLTKFNMSVLITDEFMEAVKTNSKWDLEFPDLDWNKEIYNKEWQGDLTEWKAKGYPVIIYKTFKNANELWDVIMTSTYNRNEPGVLFIDTINKLNNLYYCEKIKSTNPCGEQLLPTGGVCLLGSINLTQFVNKEKTNWDYVKLERTISYAVRLMDNVNDITYVPLPEQAENLRNKRRIGLGTLGYGSALMMMRKRYGSKDALKLTEELQSFIANEAYKTSALLAKEKGAFPLYNQEKYLGGEFVKNLSEETITLIKENGLRNSHLLSIQPTGNTSILANNVSGGLEPIFMPVYTRTSILPYTPLGLEVPININWVNKTFEFKNNTAGEWVWIKEGDENLLTTTFDEQIYKIDQSRGLLRETTIKDYAVKELEKDGSWDMNADWAATTTQLNVDEHINTMAIFAKYVDSAISKCLEADTTMVLLNNKIYYLDELGHNEIQDTFQPIDFKTIDHTKELVNVVSVYNNGVQPCIKITFDDKSSITGTFNHKIYTEAGWVSLIDFKIGMNI